MTCGRAVNGVGIKTWVLFRGTLSEHLFEWMVVTCNMLRILSTRSLKPWLLGLLDRSKRRGSVLAFSLGSHIGRRIMLQLGCETDGFSNHPKPAPPPRSAPRDTDRTQIPGCAGGR